MVEGEVHERSHREGAAFLNEREEEDEREVENGVELDFGEEACLDQGGEGDHEEDEGASA